MSELELNHDCIGDFRNLALSGLSGTKESDLGFPFAWACAIQWDAYRNAVGLTDGHQGKPILAKRPIQSGTRRLEYRVTGKGEAQRPALELIEGWGKGVSPSSAEPSTRPVLTTFGSRPSP